VGNGDGVIFKWTTLAIACIDEKLFFYCKSQLISANLLTSCKWIDFRISMFGLAVIVPFFNTMVSICFQRKEEEYLCSQIGAYALKL